MPQLKPKEQFVISRHLEDPQDTNTYYVKAFIYAKNDLTTLLDSVALTNIGTGAGDQRFAKTWEVPADPSGEGRWVVVITKVYTNSGYTTLSPLYGVEEREYLIQERMNPNLYMGGGGMNVSYEKIEKIVEGKLKKLKIPETDLKPILKAVKDIYIPKPEKTDLGPVLMAIKNIPQPREIDFSPITESLRRIAELIGAIPEFDYEKLIKAIDTAIAKAGDHATVKEVAKELKRFRKALKNPIAINIAGTMNAQGAVEEAPKEKPKPLKFQKYFEKRFR